MAPKKKGKGSKLSRMTEEERARYLQHRAAIEEEARRRKQQLIATFMKNKLKHEEAFTRLNLAKINQQWRHLLRQIKTRELKQDLENLWNLFDHVIQTKENIIKNLLKELDESEQQYGRNFQSHTEIVDQLIELHAKRLEQLHDSYKQEHRALLQEASRERRRMISGAETDEETLQTIKFQLVRDMEIWISRWNKSCLIKTDEVRNNMLSIVDSLQISSESTLEKLWREFQSTLQEYINSTQDKYSHYTRLKARDEASSDKILCHFKILASLNEQIASLKQQLANLKTTHEQKIEDLRAEHSHYNQNFYSLRNQLIECRKLDEKQLNTLIALSNKTTKELELLLEKGERILQLVNMCRRMETEREKVLPFVIGPSTAAPLSQGEQDHLEMAYKEMPSEPLVKEIFDYMKLDNFWRRYNRAHLECAALSLHREALILENQQLTRALQQYLATLAHGTEYSSQPSLTVARPMSTRIIREHINLIPETNESKERHKKYSKIRPVTCIEANTSIAVRHMLRTGAF